VFDGIHRAESQRRTDYRRVSVGSKHATQTNVSPLLDWASSEVFLYLFSRNLLLHEGYRHGFARVGCAVCPLAPRWWDSIAWLLAKDQVMPFVDVLREYARAKGVAEQEVDAFVSLGAWKGRAGGRHVPGGGNRIVETRESDRLVFHFRQPVAQWQEWAKTLARIEKEGEDKGRIVASSSGLTYPYTLVRQSNGVQLSIRRTSQADRFMIRDFRYIAFKAAYCVGCRTCEVECHTGALGVDGSITLDGTACVHCRHCLTVVEKGCWPAKSLSTTTRGSRMKLRTYQHFGMRKAWLDEFFAEPQRWWHDNSLGNRQFEAMRAWLSDGELIEGATLTPTGAILRELGANHLLTWCAIWTNLARGSTLVHWYVTQVPWHDSYSKSQLADMLPDRFAPSTKGNAITALVGLLRDTPLGTELGLGRVELQGRKTKSVTRLGTKPLPPLALVYSLYPFAELNCRHEFSASELLDSASGGPWTASFMCLVALIHGTVRRSSA